MGRTTNVARRRAQGTTAREKAAAARIAARRRERRRRVVVIVGVSVAVLAVLGALLGVGLSGSRAKSGTGGARPVAAPAVVGGVTGVSRATLDAVGTGQVATLPKAVHDAALTAAGKPEVLYIGAEFCPYCAAERWALVQALSRFGTFAGLTSIHSSGTDVYPNTPTFSFHGATYHSDVVSFTPREVETVTGAPLESPTAAENALWKRYTGQGTFPFVDIGGRYVVTAPSYDPGVLKGLTAEQIATRMGEPGSAVAKAVDGAANVLTAAICTTTHGRPVPVCTAPGVTAAAKAIGA